MLGDIFLHSLPDDWKHDINHYRRAVMLPGQVCRRWREVAITTSKMWSFISIWLGPSSECEMELTRTWLKRSAGHNLSLRVVEWQPNIKSNLPVMDTLLGLSHHWCYVDFRLSWTTLHVMGSRKYEMSTLEHLSIEMNPPVGDEESLLISPIDTFDAAPRLRGLCLHSNAPSSMLVLPWAQLTKIRMRSRVFSLDDCYDILHQSPNLVQCELMPQSSTFRESPAPLKHINLHRMLINSSTDCGPLFEALSLPSLHDFEYRNGDDNVWPQAQFVSLLRRSSCTLRRLALSFPAAVLEEDEVMECLEVTSTSLVQLTLGRECARNVTSAILARMTQPVPEGVKLLLPHLEVLALDLYRSFDGRAFAAMVESRRRIRPHSERYHPAWLRTVVLEPVTHCGFDNMTSERLRKCRERGLDIYKIEYSEAGDEVQVAL
ncbi:hypothetical protein FIBSPDRAFT_1055858 [Athelia psychrophila]|uniref:F-box domain-containing protein n=1 Tax=Athelia psychrophila TaxID=1759441 RepID=A0A167T1N5_9AGAM|nr:hypothetical protein FIBSPDRAFT_1055858 [Fibularhizoctonia sp. CBS 109695]